MSKINFKLLGTKAAGLAVGTVAAGFISKQAASFKVTDPLMIGALLIGAGAFIPTFQKGQLMQSAGDGMISKGVDVLVKKFAPDLISGTDFIADDIEISDQISDQANEFIADYVANHVADNIAETETIAAV